MRARIFGQGLSATSASEARNQLTERISVHIAPEGAVGLRKNGSLDSHGAKVKRTGLSVKPAVLKYFGTRVTCRRIASRALSATGVW